MIRGSALALVLFLSFSFAIRLGASVVMRGLETGPSPRHGADVVEYDIVAQRVAAGLGYTSPGGEPTAFRAPGFPLFLAAIYKVTGVSYPAVYVAQALVGALAAGLSLALANQVLPPPAAWLAALGVALYIPHIYFSTLFDTEALYSLLIAASVAGLFRHLRRPSPASLALSGLLFSWALLTRPFMIFFLPAAAAILYWSRRAQPARALRDAAVWTCFSLSLVAVWAARNQRLLGAPVFGSTNGGSTFYGGNNDWALSHWTHYGGWRATLHLPGRDRIEAANGEVAHDRVEWALGFEWAAANLHRLPFHQAAKMVRFLLPDFNSGNRLYQFLQAALAWPILLCVIAGFALAVRRERSYEWWLLHAVVFASLCTAFLFYGNPRFRDCNAPILLIYAAYALNRWFPHRVRALLPVEGDVPASG